jgi:hypothetical protein
MKSQLEMLFVGASCLYAGFYLGYARGLLKGRSIERDVQTIKEFIVKREGKV